MNAQLLLWLTLALAAALAPHVLHLSPWVSALTFLLIAWRLHRLRRRQPPPGRWLMLGLTLLAMAAVLSSHHTLFGREAGVTFVSLLAALKCLEMRTYRDGMVLILLMWFLVFTQFLYAQGILLAAYLVFAVLLLCTAWIALHHPRAEPLPTLRRAAVLLLQAVPIALLLFMLFPRVPGPLWGLPRDAFGAQTGLSEDMAPGSISRLIQSETVAFRVQFRNAPPPAQQLYWRGPVLNRFDGRRWSMDREEYRPPTLTPLSEPVAYTVTMEPNGKRWLFALDLPAGISLEDSRLRGDFQILRRQAVNRRLRYKASSYLSYKTDNIDPSEWQTARELPPEANPRSVALGRNWRRQAGSPERVVALALSHFRKEPYVYTLEPPLLGVNPVDDFLFRTRAGFCEHYASAFVTLMRAAGIPARVVTGYQGGEFNRFGGYLVVRQSDAHAWAEVWLDKRGWVRIDPTAAVSPLRVESGIDAVLPLAARGRGLFMADFAWLRTLRQSWDALNTQWDQWVLGFDQEKQIAFFSNLGFGFVSWRELGLGMAVGLSLLMAATAWLVLRQPRQRADPVLACYRRFCRHLEKVGLRRAPQEGPLDYARRVSAARPELADAVNRVTLLYVAMRYASAGTEENLTVLRNQVRTFRT
jgi:protein-glutamine gamma-glutamyltransferase